MKSFEQLKNIAEIYTSQATNIPNNPFLLCNRLQIKYKYKAQCLKDFNDFNPLNSSPALLYKDISAKENNNTVYFDETSKYWRFYMFHEIAHYILEHDTDDIISEKEANMLACLLIAPQSSLPTYLKTAQDLSCFCQIPIGRAEEYWNELHCSKHKEKNFIKFKQVFVSICIVAILTIGMSLFVYHTKADNIENRQETSILNEKAETNDSKTDIYYITTYGTKYHNMNCPYIKNKDNIKSISLEDAILQHYETCSVCINHGRVKFFL